MKNKFSMIKVVSMLIPQEAIDALEKGEKIELFSTYLSKSGWVSLKIKEKNEKYIIKYKNSNLKKEKMKVDSIIDVVEYIEKVFSGSNFNVKIK